MTHLNIMHHALSRAKLAPAPRPSLPPIEFYTPLGTSYVGILRTVRTHVRNLRRKGHSIASISKALKPSGFDLSSDRVLSWKYGEGPKDYAALVV
jgi:hypothetical protein